MAQKIDLSTLCYSPASYRFKFLLRIIITLLHSLIPVMPSVSQLSTTYEKEGCRATRDGLFSDSMGLGKAFSDLCQNQQMLSDLVRLPPTARTKRHDSLTLRSQQP
jgi:hypothetical protein